MFVWKCGFDSSAPISKANQRKFLRLSFTFHRVRDKFLDVFLRLQISRQHQLVKHERINHVTLGSLTWIH